MISEAVLDERSMALIEGWLKSGRYASIGEAVRDGLRVLDALEKSESERLDALRTAVRAGIDSGPSAPLDMEAVKAEGRRRLAASRAASARGEPRRPPACGRERPHRDLVIHRPG